MIEKLEAIKQRYDVLTEKIADPAVIARMDEWKKIAKERADMEETVEKYLEYKKIESDKISAEESLLIESDPDMKELLEEEVRACKKQLEGIIEELKILLLPKDPNDDKNVILEIRGGAGGEEAALFAQILYRMYSRFAESKRWKVEEIDINETELGGVKEVTFSISGNMKVVFIAFNAFPKPNHKAEFTLQPLRWRFFPK